jgi:hypothetical protein
MDYSYFKVAKSRQKFLGERYFKLDATSEAVVQVCVTAGETKKGRGNTFGIYKISRMTFLANYYAYKYAIPCTKAEYQTNFDRVLEGLS